uniref:methylamine utilization protein MauJ n=1 Tax=Paracoccus sp. TRP TaxID=412597 RepID=UPI000225EE21|nr:methylamine utilization protein MauJ [Paracoccus sp. TRP]
MWIPYDIRAALKAESSRDSISLSRADARMREFLVGFFLRNPVAQIWELDLFVPEDLHLPQIGDQAEGGAGPVRISLHGNQGGKLAEILCRLSAPSAEEALARAHAAIKPRILRYLVETGRGMAIAGWRIADLTHDARWRCTPFRPSALQLDLASLAPVAPDLVPIVTLFQRARNATDAASRLMAGFAVLHAAATGHAALARSGAASLRVSEEMLIHSGAINAPEDLQGIGLADLVGLLRPHHDRLFTAEGVLAPLADDLAAQKLLSQLANLADLVAHRLIVAETRARNHAAPSLVGPEGVGV